MMFSNAKQHIPDLFKEKMAVDKQIEDLVSPKVVHMSDHLPLMALKMRQQELRDACQEFCAHTNVP